MFDFMSYDVCNCISFSFFAARPLSRAVRPEIIKCNRCHPCWQDIGPAPLTPTTSDAHIERICTMMYCILYCTILMYLAYVPRSSLMLFLLLQKAAHLVAAWFQGRFWHCGREVNCVCLPLFPSFVWLRWCLGITASELQCRCFYSLHSPMSGLLVGSWWILIFHFDSASFIILCNLSSGLGGAWAYGHSCLPGVSNVFFSFFLAWVVLKLAWTCFSQQSP